MPRPVGQSDPGEHLLDPVPVDRPARQLQRQPDVLIDVQRGQQVEVLEDEAQPGQPQIAEPALAQLRQIGRTEQHRARGRPVEPRGALQKRALAGPGRAHHRGETGARQTDAHPAQRMHRAVPAPVALVHLPQRHRGLHRGKPGHRHRRPVLGPYAGEQGTLLTCGPTGVRLPRPTQHEDPP